MAALVLFVVAPLYWILITAFKTDLQATTRTSILWPSPWTMVQFQQLITANPFGTWYRNTVMVGVVSTVLAVLFSAMAGYALARLKFAGAQGLAGLVLLTYIMPSALLFIPLYQILSDLHLIDNLWALIVVYPTFTLPFAAWLLMGYFRSIPAELDEAATIDGATRLQSFLRIILPLARPALLAVGLFTLTNAWNEFLFAFVFITRESLKTLPVGLQSMIFGDIYPWGQLMAASILISLPVVVVYGYAQRFLVEGLTVGAVKG
jgi:multiple sugar transport system permease protein